MIDTVNARIYYRIQRGSRNKNAEQINDGNDFCVGVKKMLFMKFFKNKSVNPNLRAPVK